jgi:hypothetical protein
MELILTNTVKSPFAGKPETIWALENSGVFLVSDCWKMIKFNADGSPVLLWHTTDEDTAYRLKGIYDDRLSDEFYDEIKTRGIAGFQLLPRKEYDDLNYVNGSSAVLDIVNRYGLIDRGPLLLLAHESVLVQFTKQNILLFKRENGQLAEVTKTKFKGKNVTAVMLHPQRNQIIYGTNQGELFAQPFEQDRFGKVIKVDQLPNVCYQISFSKDSKKMFVGGLGYLKIYDLNGDVFSPDASLMTACKSFEIAGQYLVLNKGMHGIDVLRIHDNTERVSALDLPFPIDRMVYLAPQKTFLLTSAEENDLYFLKCSW